MAVHSKVVPRVTGAGGRVWLGSVQDFVAVRQRLQGDNAKGALDRVNAGSILTPLFRPNFDPLWLC